MLNFSVVIPVYNEEASVMPLYFSLRNVMNKLGRPYEIIFVNDGSEDRSLEVLNSIDSKPSNLAIVNLCRNSGKSAAMQAGFDIARGELIITMDGDLQNDPEDIPGLLDKMKDGYDVVCGWRYDRKDPWKKVISAKIAGAVRKFITGENIHDVGCALRVFKNEVLKDVCLSGGLHRFFALIMLKLGYRIGEVKVQHHPRKFGKSKYNTGNRLWEGAKDLLRISFCDIHGLMKRESNHEMKNILWRRKWEENRVLIFVLLITILGFLLRLHHLGGPGLRWPEPFTATRIDFSLIQTVKNLFISPFPPLYYILMNLWVKIFGNSEFSLRFPSLMFSTVSIIFIFKLAKEVFGENAGLISALLFSISPYSIKWAQLAKMYSMLWCLGILSFLFFVRFVKDNKTGSLVSYVVFTAMSIYTMYIGFIYIVIQNAYFFIFRRNAGHRKRWILGQLMIFLLYLPWIDKFVNNAIARTGVKRISEVDNWFIFLKKMFFLITGISTGGPDMRLQYLEFFLYLFLIISAILYFGNIGRRKGIFDFTRNDFLIFGWITMPVIIYCLINIFFFPLFRHRYAGSIHIPLIILFSKGMVKYNVKFRSVLLLFLLIIISSTHLHPYYRHRLQMARRQDWRSLFSELDKRANNDDLIIFSGAGRHLTNYYDTNGHNIHNEMKDPNRLAKKLSKDGKHDSIFIAHYGRQRHPIKTPEGYKFAEHHSVSKNFGFFWYRKAGEK